MLKQISYCLLIGILLRIQPSVGILNRRHQLRTDTLIGERHYLNAKRPLWILDDSVQHNDFERISYSSTTTRPLTHPWRRRQQMQQRLRNNFPQRHIKLPNHYYNYRLGTTPQRARNMRRTELLLTTTTPATHSMPKFDSFPGQDNTDPVPIFIYNGPKGELLLNTMLSTKQYPMQEPVPGEILYPPTTPIFRPKPIVQRYRVKEQQHSAATPLNLTLIPFYAHEAIDPRSLSNFDEMDVATTPEPSVFYAAAPPLASSSPNNRKSKHSKLSKWQKYKVFHSKDDVQWQPSVKIELPHTTTAFPMAAAPPPLRNHRYSEEAGKTLFIPTSKPLNHYKSMRDNEGNFRIIYTDEESSTVEEPPHSSRYVASQEIFAFPVFTLGKLLTSDHQRSSEESDVKAEASGMLSKREEDDETLKQQHNASANTLFVLNSRYKGRFKDLSKYRYSSKYVENPTAIAASDFAAYDAKTK